MRDALSSLDQLVAFRGDKVTEEDALGVFGLVSRSALEGLAGAILRGDVAEILEAIDLFESSGRNMRRLSGELLQHFRNLAVVQALGPETPSLAATPDQVRTLVEQARGIDPNRVFRICDQLVEMEDKLRYVLSARTLIEMSLIRASRLATTATIEELMRAVRAMKSGDAQPAASAKPGPNAAPARPAAVAPTAPSAPKPAAPVAPPAPQKREAPPPADANDILNDPKFNAILTSLPGATVVGIH